MTALARATVGELARATLTDAVERLVRQDAVLRADAGGEAVHDARVAVRRLRSDLRTFCAVLDRDWSTDLRERLRRPQDGFSAARDADVLLERVERSARALPDDERAASEVTIDVLRDDRARAYERMRAMLDDPEYGVLLLELLAASAQPPLRAAAAEPACHAAGALVGDAWSRLRRRVRRRSRPPADAELHAIRIGAKRVRYAAEAVAPVAGRVARRLARAVERLQTVLGEQHDAVIARERLRGFAGDPRRAFAAGQLAALEHLSAERCAAAWHDEWCAVKRAYRTFRRAL